MPDPSVIDIVLERGYTSKVMVNGTDLSHITNRISIDTGAGEVPHADIGLLLLGKVSVKVRGTVTLNNDIIASEIEQAALDTLHRMLHQHQIRPLTMLDIREHIDEFNAEVRHLYGKIQTVRDVGGSVGIRPPAETDNPDNVRGADSTDEGDGSAPDRGSDGADPS